MRNIIGLLIGTLLLVSCTSQASFGEPITEGEPTPVPTDVVPSKPTYEPQIGDVVDRREFFGRVAPVLNQELIFEIDGRVAEVFIDQYDEVSEGDVIAELDTSALEQQLLTAQNNLDIATALLESVENGIAIQQQRARLQLYLAQLSLDFAISQSGENPTAEQNYDIQVKTIERDLAQLDVDELRGAVDPQLAVDVAQAQQEVDQILADIEKTKLLAPMDGTVISLRLSPGSVITAYEIIGVISDTNNIEVRDVWDEDTLSELTEGMAVELANTTGPQTETYPGTLRILPAPFGTGSDEFVHVFFDDPAHADLFGINDRVEIRIVVSEAKDVLWLPVNAIRDFNGRKFVVVQTDSIQQRLDVTLGIEGDGRVQILEGVTENMVVIGQ